MRNAIDKCKIQSKLHNYYIQGGHQKNLNCLLVSQTVGMRMNRLSRLYNLFSLQLYIESFSPDRYSMYVIKQSKHFLRRITQVGIM